MSGSLEIESNRIATMLNAWKKIQTIFNWLNDGFISIVAIYMTFFCFNAGNKPVTWHTWFCTIGVRDFPQ